MARFLDTNILLRYLAKPVTADDQRKAERATDLLLRVEQGDERVVTSPMVVFEAVLTLHRSYRVEREVIRECVSAIISLRGVQLPNKRLYLAALLFAQTNISFADCFNAVAMRASGLDEIYSWDTDFDKIDGVARVEP
jgi:predicted nucleic acid-binding protein